MAGKLAIHVPPDAYPDNVVQLVQAAAGANMTFGSMGEIADFALSIGLGDRGELPWMALHMGLFRREDAKSPIKVSSAGEAFTQIKPEIQGEILHFLIYSGWHEATPTEFLPSWAYRQCCKKYWDAESFLLNATALDNQVTEIINEAEIFFADLNVGEFDGISFSRKSLTGVRKWLDALHPAVIQDNTFQRRSFCPPELVLLAIGFVMRDEPDVADIDILLGHERREAICRLCLLDPLAFDQTLDWTLPLFPQVISGSEDVGYYGRSIRLRKLPTLEDVIR